MIILATFSDIEVFIFERSPHVKSVKIYEGDDIVAIEITLSWWYRFFYEKIFYQYITALFEEYAMYGVTYDIIIKS